MLHGSSELSLVKVTWEDACELDDTPWTGLTEHTGAPVVVQVGFVLEDTDKHLVLTHAYTTGGEVARRNLIPKGMIVKVETL